MPWYWYLVAVVIIALICIFWPRRDGDKKEDTEEDEPYCHHCRNGESLHDDEDMCPKCGRVGDMPAS